MNAASAGISEARAEFARYVKHRDLAAAAAMRASHRTGGTATWQREIDNHDRHLELAEKAAAALHAALAKACGK